VARLSLGLLRSHDFRQLFVADTISQVGTQVTLLALPLVAVLTLNARPFEVGLLATMESLPFLLIGLPAGAWVDRLRRRSVMVVGDVVRALLLASVPVTWWLGSLSMDQLYAVGFFVGIGTVFFDVAYQSYLPHLVGRENLVEGNAKLEVVRATTQLGGPTAAGWLVQWLSAPYAIAADAISFAGSALFLGRVRNREPQPERKADAHLGKEIWEGLRFVLSNRLLRSIAACTGSFNLFWSAAMPMLLIYLVRDVHLSPGQIGLIFSISSCGGLLGAFVVKPLVRWLGQGPAIWVSTGVTTPFALALPLAHHGWSIWAAAGAFTMVGLGVVVYNVTQVSFRQGLTPERLLGRMNATMRFLVWGTMPLGGLLGGVLGDWLGPRTTVFIGFGGACLAFLFVFASPLRWMRELPTPAAEAAAAEPAVSPAG
jgi:MFS family permease